jgi:hypothetical protein
MQSDRVFWGLGLVLVGFLFLLETVGLLDVSWQLFIAVVLVGAGIGLLIESQTPSAKGKHSALLIPRDNAQQAHINIEHGLGRLHVEDELLQDMVMVSRNGRRIDKRIVRQGDRVNIKVSPTVPGCINMIMPWEWFSDGNTWQLGLNPEMPLKLHIESGASQNDLDLTHLNVESLHLETGASTSLIELPENVTQTEVKIEAGAASVDVRVPASVAARIKVDGALADIDIDTQRFPKDGSVYQSPDYETAKNRANIQVDIGAGRLVID